MRLRRVTAMSLTKPALTAVSGGTKIGAFKIGVGRIERHQLQHNAVGPAKAVLGWIGVLRGAKVRASQLETTAVSPPFSLIHSSIWTGSEWRAGRSAFIGLKIG